MLPVVAAESSNHGVPQNVERASEVMNNVPDNEWDIFWHRLNIDPHEWLSSIRITLRTDGVVFRCSELHHAALQRLEMLVGPTNFQV